MDDRLKKIKKKSKQGAIISIIGFIIILLTYVFFIINQEKKTEQLQQSIQQTQVLIDSTRNLKHIVDSAKIQEKINERINKVIYDYVNYSNSQNVDSVITLFSDTLSRFFLRTDVTKDFVKEHLKWYWNQYPNATYEYDLKNIAISDHDSNNYQIIISGNHSQDGIISKEVLSYIRLNSNFKIYFTRDYLPE